MPQNVPDGSPPRSRSRLASALARGAEGWLCAAIASATLVVFLLLHLAAGDAFPVPWTDEAHFLWQSVAFAQTGSLLSPVLNADRPILWMPPAYMILMGIAFKAAGISLALARWVSFVLLAGAFLGLVGISSELGRPPRFGNGRSPQERIPAFGPLAALLSGAFFLSPTFVAAGNVARMEALLLFLVVAALALLARSRLYSALAVLLALPLVHPNGLFFLCAGIAWLLAAPVLGVRRGRPSRTEAVALFLAALLWLGYALYVARHWPAFCRDMLFQFSRKENLVIEPGFLFEKQGIALALLFAACVAWALRLGDVRALLLLVVSAAAGSAWWVGREMWYRVLADLGSLFFSLAILRIATISLGRFVARRRKPPPATIRNEIPIWLPLALTLVLFAWHVRAGRICPLWVGQLPDCPWYEMRIERGASYASRDDLAAVRSYLDGLLPPGARPLPVVEFWPKADSLLFADLNERRIRISAPLFCEKQADVYIFHVSRFHPPAPWFVASLEETLRKAGLQDDDKCAFYRAGDSGRWFGAAPGLSAKSD